MNVSVYRQSGDSVELETARAMGSLDLVEVIRQPDTVRVRLLSLATGKPAKEYTKKTCASRFACTRQADNFTWVIIKEPIQADWKLT